MTKELQPQLQHQSFQWIFKVYFLSVQFSSMAHLHPTLWDPMNHSTYACLSITICQSSLKLTFIESGMPSSHLILCRSLCLLPPIPPSIEVFSNESTLHISTGLSALSSFLPKKSQSWSPSEWTGWIFLQSKGLSRVFSNTTVQKHQFFGAQLSSQSNSHIHTWPLGKPWPWLDGPLLANNVSAFEYAI